ncbi:nicotianamine synthase family protein [Actinomycetospora termitidis]|uniref:Nicotianamine synthase family protein n=1 Tax=Actinomycetospora termitidis TaxID=3053470 RepID=A0ABT7MCN1_9PSEU|nr:nicotianamine synthase family protein [Actinomycetospora sp. Odt1-22]MDL5158422.1 nicotianamine synthase family protein [Actinomycetospora sp. Odt1-22]
MTPIRRSVGRSGQAQGLPARPAVHGCGHGDTGSSRAGSVVAEVLALHGALADRADLSPGPETNDLFGRLVALAIEPGAAREAETVLADPAVATLLPELRRLCADGEYHLEEHWARRVLAASDPAAELARFPYHQNYVDLTRLEHHAVTGLVPEGPRRVLFVGSGPLPLTSMLLAERYGCEVDNLDHAPEAATLGGALATALGRTGLRFRTGEAEDVDGLERYDLVYLAALAGLEPTSKQRLLAHLGRCLAPGTLVLARSAHSLRGLLYPVLDPHDLPGLETLSVVHPFTDVVNSVVVARVPG